MRLLFKVIFNLLAVIHRLVWAALPAFLLLIVLSSPISAKRGIRLIVPANKQHIHDLIPNTKWGQLIPCGAYLEEKEQFEQARSCVNKKVWAKSPLSEELNYPRCYVVPAESVDVFSDDSGTFNFVAITDPFGRVGAVVGFYDPPTKTVFVVENNDMEKVYRHELQHYFLHIHDPITEGGGHHQEIWKKCEEPYYTPSLKAKIIAQTKRKIDKSK